MTTEQINIAVAKVEGFSDFTWIAGHQFADKLTMPKPFQRQILLPRYTTSYDAILPVIQRQDVAMIKTITLDFVDGSELADYTGMIIMMATPLQLCIALLKAKGLYHE